MKSVYLKFFAIAISLFSQNISLAFGPQEPKTKLEIISRFDKPESTDNDIDIKLYKPLGGGVIESSDGSRYLFVLRNNKLRYFKKQAACDAEWGDEKPVMVANGVSELVYPTNFRSIFVYPFGNNLVKIVAKGWRTYSETRTLNVDLKTMTLVKNEITIKSTAHLYKEYRSQTALPPRPGPQIPLATEIYRTEKLRSSKGIYYYKKLTRQENGRIVRKEYYRYTVNGVWSQEYEVGRLELPDDVTESYKSDNIMMVYGQDLTKDRFALVRMRRKEDANKKLPQYILLIYRETPSGSVSLEIVEKNLANFSPLVEESFFGLMVHASYNEKTSELSISSSSQPETMDQVFSVYNMSKKKIVKTRTITHTKGFTAVFITDLLTEDGESIGLQKYRRFSDVANFYFVKWSGSGEQNFYKISDGPDAEFGTPWARMVWSEDQTRIYTSDQSGTICQTDLIAGTLRCATPDLGEGIDGENGSLTLVKDGVVELVSSTYEYNREEDSRDTIIYSAVVDFN